MHVTSTSAASAVSAVEAAEDRFLFTIVGAIIAVILGVIFSWLGRKAIDDADDGAGSAAEAAGAGATDPSSVRE